MLPINSYIYLAPAYFGFLYWLGLAGLGLFIGTVIFYRVLKGSVLRRRIINELINEVEDQPTLKANVSLHDNISL
jgi:hypothetical protein